MMCMYDVDSFSDMFNKMHGFMKKGMLTDVTFNVGGSKIESHKGVLASCSSVFQAMFQSSFAEGQSNEVVINDVNQEVFSAFLDYIYVRDVKIVEKHVHQLLMLADKYDVERLALLCDGIIGESLTAENAVESLLLANLYKRLDLKAKVGRFIRDHLETVATHQSWTKLGENFEVMNGLMHSFIQKEDSGVRTKLSNSVIWTLRNVHGWYSKTEIVPWEALTLTDCDPEIVFNVSLTCLNNCIAVNIKVDNKLDESFPSVFVINKSSIFGLQAQTKICLTWAPNSSELAKIYVPHDLLKDRDLAYPLYISVVVKKSELSDQHQLTEKYVERDMRFADADIRVGNSKFPIHKFVLSKNSEFFSTLFKNNRKLYMIEGMDRNTFRILLNYMYSLTNPPPEEIDVRLLRGAKQIQLNHLVEYCVSTLQKNMNCDNVVEICTTGEELGLEQLVSAAMNFMAKDAYKIMNSRNWPTMKNHQRLTTELLFRLKNLS